MRPNIIFILTDDMGFGDAHFQGHPYLKTPNLDRLAREGTVFTHFYSCAAVCSPSRAAFMTGRFPAYLSINLAFVNPYREQERGMARYLDLKWPTITRYLQRAGYAVGHFGKWHLTNPRYVNGPTPDRYGIDVYRTPNMASAGPPYDMKDPYYRAKSTQWFVDDALAFIRQCRAGEVPFYVNLWTLVPHALLKPTEEELAVYEDLEVDPDDFPHHMARYLAQAEDPQAQMRVYCAAMTGLDAAIGNLLDELDALGLAEDTLIVFTSDNGPEDYHVGNASNAGMGHPGVHRGRKRSLYDGGVRMPCIVRWPERVPAGRVNRTSVWAAVDWLPTLCSLVRVPLGDDCTPDGEDVGEMLWGDSADRTRPLFWEWRFAVPGDPTYKPPELGVCEGRWKAYVNADGTELALYDIIEDPEEMRDVAEQFPETAAHLKGLMLDWKKTLPQ